MHGRLASQATTASLVIMYTVPPGQQASIYSMCVCNRDGTNASDLTMAILDPGEAVGDVDTADYIYATDAIAADTTEWTHFPKGLPLAAGFSVAILGNDTDLTVSLFGSAGET